ncbi:hypothetical protein ABTL25_20140, partial [Acinetobacter baumannii]
VHCVRSFTVSSGIHTSNFLAAMVVQWLKKKKKKICLPMQEMQVQSLGQEYPLEKEMASHSSIFAWEMPWTEEPGGL